MFSLDTALVSILYPNFDLRLHLHHGQVAAALLKAVLFSIKTEIDQCMAVNHF